MSSLLFIDDSLTYNSFVSSYPFCFLVGPQKKKFYVHADLVAQSSSSLHFLVNGPMTEASQKFAILEDVDEETIVRFIEYLYTKDYTVANPEIVLESPDILEIERGTGELIVETGPNSLEIDQVIDAEAEPAEEPGEAPAEAPEEAPEEAPAEEPEASSIVPEDDTWGVSAFKKVKGKKKKLKSNPWHDELPAPPAEILYPGECKKDRAWRAFEEKACVQPRDTWEPYQNTESYEDYTEVFLCHARLYVFSDRQGIEPLRELSLQKMRLTLSRFHLFDERISDIVELIRYTYANTMEHDQGIDILRSLVMDYVVCKLEKVVDDEKFQEMLKEPGALAKDLVLRLVHRLD